MKPSAWQLGTCHRFPTQLFCSHLRRPRWREETFDLDASLHSSDVCRKLYTFSLCVLIGGAWHDSRWEVHSLTGLHVAASLYACYSVLQARDGFSDTSMNFYCLWLFMYLYINNAKWECKRHFCFQHLQIPVHPERDEPSQAHLRRTGILRGSLAPQGPLGNEVLRQIKQRNAPFAFSRIPALKRKEKNSLSSPPPRCEPSSRETGAAERWGRSWLRLFPWRTASYRPTPRRMKRWPVRNKWKTTAGRILKSADSGQIVEPRVQNRHGKAEFSRSCSTQME